MRWRVRGARRCRPTAVVTDVASTKSAILGRADAAGLRFVGGHPMAGLETTGYAAADGRLFVDRPWVIVSGAHAEPADAGRVADLATACAARVVLLDAAAHDRAVAAISHLPLLVAAALAESIAGLPERRSCLRRWSWPRAAGATPRGSVAAIRRWARPIVATNAPALGARIRDLRAVLDGWLAELERPGGPDEAAVRDRLAAARASLDERG